MVEESSVNGEGDSSHAARSSPRSSIDVNPNQRLSSVLLNEFNYLPWERAVTLALGGRSKLGYVNGAHQITMLGCAKTSWSCCYSTLWIVKGRSQCTRLPLYAGSGRGECRLALPPFMERLLPSLEPETYRSWAKALAIAPSATSMLNPP
ncbi:hypothetical protein EV2_018767 [Malus domestica]